MLLRFVGSKCTYRDLGAKSLFVNNLGEEFIICLKLGQLTIVGKGPLEHQIKSFHSTKLDATWPGLPDLLYT